jgi:hypothetical protein
VAERSLDFAAFGLKLGAQSGDKGGISELCLVVTCPPPTIKHHLSIQFCFLISTFDYF